MYKTLFFVLALFVLIGMSQMVVAVMPPHCYESCWLGCDFEANCAQTCIGTCGNPVPIDGMVVYA